MSFTVAGIKSRVSSEDLGTSALTKRAGLAKCSYLDRVACVLGAAMLVIGILTLTGHLSGVVAGGCAAGLSVTLALYAVLRPRKEDMSAKKVRRERIVKAIACIGLLAIATLASLVAAGVLPKMALGITTVSAFGIPLMLLTLKGCIKCTKKLVKSVGSSQAPDRSAYGNARNRGQTSFTSHTHRNTFDRRTWDN